MSYPEPREPTGFGPQEMWLRSLLRWCKSGRVRSVYNGDLIETTDGQIIRCLGGAGGGAPAAATPATVQAFKIAALADIQADYIACTPVAGIGPKVNVARPSKLRMSVGSATLDGNVVTYSNAAYAGTDKFVRRDATLLGITEKQVIVPRYLVNDVIYAMKVTGGSGVTIAGIPVDYIDLNVDGRAWAFKADQTT